VSERHDVWITGIGIVSALGEGLEQHWTRLMQGGQPPYDDKTFAPYITYPLVPVNFDTQIPKKGDQRQMEAWQRIGVYAAGLALTDAGIAKNAEILDKTDMIVAAGGGERDVAVDSAILSDVRKAEKPEAFVNERLMSDLRPTLFLAQLPNLLAGNISLVHGVVGSSRTFMGEEASGVDALRVAHARIAAGQSEISLVGGAYNGTRWDLVLLFKLGTPLLEGPFKPVWDRGPNGAIALAAMGAFVVLESRAHAEKRGAKPIAKLTSVQSSRNLRKPGEAETTLRHEWNEIAGRVKKDAAVVISGASGAEPATKIVINLERLQQLPADKVGPLARYAAAIQSQRGDYNGKVLSIRTEDLRSLAIIYDLTPGELTEQLVDWGVLPPEARPLRED